MLSYIIIASLLEILVAFVGVFFIFLGVQKFRKYLPYFISFSVGTFLGVVFFDVLPEAIHLSTVEQTMTYTLIGFLGFFLLSRILFWYHHHEDENGHENNHIKTSAHMVLAGDVIHNFIDGVIIALAFMADTSIGIVTTIAVLSHEFPQEASDFFVLINAGMKKGKALFFNLLVSLPTLIAAVLTYFFASGVENIIAPALAIVAGNFLYIAASDLIPELHTGHHERGTSTLIQFSLILLGIGLLFFIGTMVHGH